MGSFDLTQDLVRSLKLDVSDYDNCVKRVKTQIENCTAESEKEKLNNFIIKATFLRDYKMKLLLSARSILAEFYSMDDAFKKHMEQYRLPPVALSRSAAGVNYYYQEPKSKAENSAVGAGQT